jgi:hypothetical protein
MERYWAALFRSTRNLFSVSDFSCFWRLFRVQLDGHKYAAPFGNEERMTENKSAVQYFALKGHLLGFVLETIGRSVLEKAFVNSIKAIEARNGIVTQPSAA